MIDEGYIKYRCEWVKADIVQREAIAPLTAYRNALHQLNFIGEYPDGIGFGNISQQIDPLQTSPDPNAPPQFIISGTQTGNLETLTAADYALVTTFNPAQNSLSCKGLRQASSESLTHGVIYQQHPAIRAIIHVHHRSLWQQLLHQVPTTREAVPYGTPEMAAETQRLFRESALMQQRIFAMAGHEDGVVVFGESLQTAYRVLINWSVMTGIICGSKAAAALQKPYQHSLKVG